jgi:hypothetical protein
MKTDIVTKRHTCGPYEFVAKMPRIGTAADQERWSAKCGGELLPGAFDTLEDAMRAVLCPTESSLISDLHGVANGPEFYGAGFIRRLASEAATALAASPAPERTVDLADVYGSGPSAPGWKEPASPAPAVGESDLLECLARSQHEMARLHATIAAKDAALRPFARAAEGMADFDDSNKVSVELRHCRHAQVMLPPERAALSPSGEEEIKAAIDKGLAQKLESESLARMRLEIELLRAALREACEYIRVTAVAERRFAGRPPEASHSSDFVIANIDAALSPSSGEDPVTRTGGPLEPTDYLIWSNEHRAWWRPNSRGYTVHLEAAGRYTRAEAVLRSRSRDQRPGEPLPEIPVREHDALDVLTYALAKDLEQEIAKLRRKNKKLNIQGGPLNTDDTH